MIPSTNKKGKKEQETEKQQHRQSTLFAPHDVMAWDAETALPNAATNTTALLRIARPCHMSHGEKKVSHHATASAGHAVKLCIHDGVCPSTNTPTKKVPPDSTPTMQQHKNANVVVGCVSLFGIGGGWLIIRHRQAPTTEQ